jgi:UDP-glucose 4-epimerase
VAPGQHTQVIGSVADPAAVSSVFADYGIEAVIHAGALHKPDIARFPAQAFVDTNVTGTLNLLEAAVQAGHDRFVFTSTTSLMISQAIRDGLGHGAVWLDEQAGPLEPRNIYGVTKLAAEGLCRLHHKEHGLNCVVLRTARFFPEEDDSHTQLSGENMKANELLHRRLTVEDAADIHIAALEQAPRVGFDVLIASAHSPFTTDDLVALKEDAASVVSGRFPDAAELYAARGWHLPRSIGRVYDSSRAGRVLGFRCRTDFRSVLDAMAAGVPLPFVHDPGYLSPSTLSARNGPNQVVSASASPRCVSPSHATCPSGRISTAATGVTDPIAGSSQRPS